MYVKQRLIRIISAITSTSVLLSNFRATIQECTPSFCNSLQSQAPPYFYQTSEQLYRNVHLHSATVRLWRVFFYKSVILPRFCTELNYFCYSLVAHNTTSNVLTRQVKYHFMELYGQLSRLQQKNKRITDSMHFPEDSENRFNCLKILPPCWSVKVRSTTQCQLSPVPVMCDHYYFRSVLK